MVAKSSGPEAFPRGVPTSSTTTTTITPSKKQHKPYKTHSSSSKKQQRSPHTSSKKRKKSRNSSDNDEDVLMVSKEKKEKKDEEEGLKLEAGLIIPEKCIKIVKLVSSKPREEGEGSFIPGYAIVSVKTKFLVKKEPKKTSQKGDIESVECKLPYHQILDEYDEDVIESYDKMNDLAGEMLRVGKKIDQKALVLNSSSINSKGQKKLAVISLKPSFVETAEKMKKKEESQDDDDMETDKNKKEDETVLLPSSKTGLYMGAIVQGYVDRKDSRYGSFVHFLDSFTGLLPRLKRGMKAGLYDTITCKIVALDMNVTPPKILLQKCKSIEKDQQLKKKKRSRSMDENEDGKEESSKKKKTKTQEKKEEGKAKKMDPKDVPVGTNVTAIVTQVINPFKPSLLQEGKSGGLKVQVYPGVSGFVRALEVTNKMEVLKDLKSYFPVGCSVTCRVLGLVAVGKGQSKHSLRQLDLSILLQEEEQMSPPSSLKSKKKNRIPGVNQQYTKPKVCELVLGTVDRHHHSVHAPALMIRLRGGYVGRCDITELDDRSDWINMPLGKHNWKKDPKGKQKSKRSRTRKPGVTDSKEEQEVKKEEIMDIDKEKDGRVDDDDKDIQRRIEFGAYPHGRYVQCRVLNSDNKGDSHSRIVEVSVRNSRILDKNLLKDDYDGKIPEVGSIVHAYAATTSKMGCFVRVSRSVEGRVILKHLSDDFLHDPASAFPPGRLVVGKVKEVKKEKQKNGASTVLDLDLRESTLLEAKKKLVFKDIKVGSKYKGRVVKIETFGVFVQIENSDLSGLAHISECSDGYVKNLSNLYFAGDLVKALVVKTDEKTKRIGLSLKSSHFEDDGDSDDSSSSSSEEDSSDESDDSDDDEVEVTKTTVDLSGDNDDDSINSDDENYASKLAEKLQKAEKKMKGKGEKQDSLPEAASSDSDDGSSSSSEEDDSGSSDDSSDDDDDDDKDKKGKMMDTDVGFDWGGVASSKSKGKKTTGNISDSSSSDESSDDSDDDDMDDDKKKSSHKSRKKAAAKRREEKEIALRESALADGTADENPETPADFERLLASDPNNSESWIKYMAFHLSLADIDSARSVANRAFDRIEFRQEREKLNVWTALLTLELKYGTSKSLQKTIDRACQHNNPKQVYLRVCEMLEREVEAGKAGNASSVDQVDAISRADEMFAKMCKKFKSKKTVWIAHLTYLLKSGRHTEAHALLKRALLSLAEYKHIETMSKFAQLEFEHGSMERARTIFDGLLEKHPKKMDLVFVYVDKEVKNGEIQAARNLFERIVNPPAEGGTEGKKKKSKMSDKQMKALFKKWYRMEEDHGDDETRDHVKESARLYVERSTASKS